MKGCCWCSRHHVPLCNSRPLCMGTSQETVIKEEQLSFRPACKHGHSDPRAGISTLLRCTFALSMPGQVPAHVGPCQNRLDARPVASPRCPDLTAMGPLGANFILALNAHACCGYFRGHLLMASGTSQCPWPSGILHAFCGSAPALLLGCQVTYAVAPVGEM